MSVCAFNVRQAKLFLRSFLRHDLGGQFLEFRYLHAAGRRLPHRAYVARLSAIPWNKFPEANAGLHDSGLQDIVIRSLPPLFSSRTLEGGAVMPNDPPAQHRDLRSRYANRNWVRTSRGSCQFSRRPDLGLKG